MVWIQYFWRGSLTLDSIRRFFRSPKVAISLSIILVLALIAGTIIPQNGPKQAYIDKYGEVLYRLFELFSITDLYHAWWFVGLLFLLGTNITVCSISRFPRVLRSITRSKKEISDSVLSGLPFQDEAIYPGDITRVCRHLVHRFKKRRYRIVADDYQGQERVTFFAEKGRWGRLGPWMTHLGILIVLLGGAVGGLTGFKGYVEIFEGETATVPSAGFRIRLEEFKVEYYPGSKRPKDYKSTLTVIDEGEEVLTKTIEVNHPLIYKGVWFYQSSYGVGDVEGITINVKGEEFDQDFQVKIGDTFRIPDTDYVVGVTEFLPDFIMVNGVARSRSAELNNPAARLEVLRDGEVLFKEWVFYKFPDYRRYQDEDLRFTLTGFRAPYYTGLQVVKDPGVPVVWIGCGVLLIGLVLSLFMPHRRIWGILKAEGEEVRVKIGGSTTNDRFVFEKELTGLLREWMRRKLQSDARKGEANE